MTRLNVLFCTQPESTPITTDNEAFGHAAVKRKCEPAVDVLISSYVGVISDADTPPQYQLFKQAAA